MGLDSDKIWTQKFGDRGLKNKKRNPNRKKKGTHVNIFMYGYYSVGGFINFRAEVISETPTPLQRSFVLFNITYRV